METINRYFYRCPDCLIVAALDQRPVPYAECDTCRNEKGAAHMEFMGRVEQDKLVNEFERPACDDRCTSARGPCCNCKCGGINHGSHLWVTVRIVNDIPTVSAPKDAAKYRKQAEAFNAACRTSFDTIKSKVGADIWERFHNRGWINNRDTWLAIHYGIQAVNKARRMREQNARMKTVNKVIAQFS